MFGPDIEGEILIARPVGEVFDFVADERNEPLYNPQLTAAEKITAGPVGAGTQYRATTTTMGRTVSMTIETTGYDRPRLLASSTRLPVMTIRGTLTFEPVPAGTRMRWSWRVRPRGLFRLLTPAIAWRGRQQERVIWAGLKRYLETT